MHAGNPIQERDARTLAKAIQTNKKHFSIRSLFNFPAKFNPEDWGRLGQLGRNMVGGVRSNGREEQRLEWVLFCAADA